MNELVKKAQKKHNLFEVLAANSLILIFGDLSELFVKFSGFFREL